MRGVHLNASVVHPREAGSSPHARGPRDSHLGWIGRKGIIPACAGSTIDGHAADVNGKDHPRMRGVHPTGALVSSKEEGSSPHARGPLGAMTTGDKTYRIIPACAGSTDHQKVDVYKVKDHPRMRGVHFQRLWTQIKSAGSSPHARGPPPPRVCQSPRPGIIPACAGST